MKKFFTPVPAWLSLASTILMFSSCQKAIDYVKDHGNGNPQNSSSGCNIQQIIVHTTNGSPITYTFSYNAAGDPVSVKNTIVGTGNPNTVFKYDKYGRMIEMIRPYDNGNYETWTKYSYNNSGLIVRDTQYVSGTYVDSLPVAFPRFGFWTHRYTYDGLDRIVSRTDSSFGFGAPTGATTTFQYGTNGNITGGAAYDTHANFLLTNKIWVFLCNNYSLNNHFQASGYNDHELPLAFQGPSQLMAPVVCTDGQFEVAYTCSPVQMQK